MRVVRQEHATAELEGRHFEGSPHHADDRFVEGPGTGRGSHQGSCSDRPAGDLDEGAVGIFGNES